MYAKCYTNFGVRKMKVFIYFALQIKSITQNKASVWFYLSPKGLE